MKKLYLNVILIAFVFSVSAVDICKPKPCDCDKPGTINCDDENLGTVVIVPTVEPDEVTVLSLKSNRITKIRRGQILSGKSAGLTRLTLSYNLITQIDDNAFETAPNLDYLDLNNNRLANLTDRTFEGLPKLTTLHLDHNLFKNLTIPNLFASNPKLRYLSIDYTPIKEIGNETFAGLDNLIELSIDHAELSFLPKNALISFSRVETLSMRHNRFVVVPDELHWLGQLKHLDLSGNPILTLNSNAFRYNGHLRTVAFINMPKLSYIEDCAFCNLHELRTLEIRNCSNLTDFDPEAFGRDDIYFRSLETVDLVNNSFTMLDEDLLPWENVSGVIRLSGNPWKCDCTVLWMINPALKYDKAELPLCTSPSSLQGRPIPSLGRYEPGLCVTARLSTRIRTARMFLIVAVIIVIFGAVTTAWYALTNRRKSGWKLRNMFYKPQLPKYAYRNLAMGEEPENDTSVVSNDGATILPKNTNKRDLASRLADDV